MKKRMNKRGEPISLTYLIGIVFIIALAVLVLIAMGGGFGEFGDFIRNMFGGSSNNKQSVVNGCNTACGVGQNAAEAWCNDPREVKFDNDKSNPDNRDDWTCQELAEKGKIEGLDPCSTITCADGRCQDSDAGRAVCVSQNDKGRDACVAISGCDWVDNEEDEDDLMGACNNVENFNCFTLKTISSCQTAGCEWVA